MKEEVKDTDVYLKVSKNGNFILIRSTKEVHEGVVNIFLDNKYSIKKADKGFWEYFKIRNKSYEIDTQEELDVLKNNTDLIKRIGV
tara:strand:+ start:61 stop:318 length:258 start_codon:yes stop_codon:yes gene_type:complete